MTVLILSVTPAASADGWFGTEPLPNGSETESIFEMLDSVYAGAMAIALVSVDNEDRYVFIVGADARSMYIFDPDEPGLKHIDFCESEELNFQKFYVYYSDSPFDELVTN